MVELVAKIIHLDSGIVLPGIQQLFSTDGFTVDGLETIDKKALSNGQLVNSQSAYFIGDKLIETDFTPFNYQNLIIRILNLGL